MKRLVKNVQAAQSCEIETRGRIVRLLEPRRFTDPGHQSVPAPVGSVWHVTHENAFMSRRVVLFRYAASPLTAFPLARGAPAAANRPVV